MRYIKKLALYTKSPANDRFSVLEDNRLVTNSKASLQVPTGATADRPTGAALVDGTIRFNTTLNEFEVYNSLNPASPGWERLRTVRQAPITPQNLGYGNYSDYIFGPLAYDVDQTKPQNILVFVDNVYQVPTTNYSLVSDPSGSTSTLAISTASGVTTLYLNTLTNIDAGDSNGNWRTVSAASGISVGTTVTSVSATFNFTFYGYPITISLPTTGVLTSGTALTFGYSAGTYVQFTEVVPAKPVFALLGFDGYWPNGY